MIIAGSIAQDGGQGESLDVPGRTCVARRRSSYCVTWYHTGVTCTEVVYMYIACETVQ